MKLDASLLCGFAAVLIVPRLNTLYKIASRKGRIAIGAQLVALLLLRRVNKSRQAIDLESIPKAIIPSLTLGALISDWAIGGKSSRGLLWSVLTVGMIPNLYEVLDVGFSSVTSGEADIPALIAMQLGLCLNQVRAASVILLMLTGGEAFEEHALNRAGDSIHSLLEQSPGIAHVQQGSDLVEVNSIDVKKGDCVLIKQGEEVPVDGVLIDKACIVDESLLSGEGLPLSKYKRDTILAGSRNKGAAFLISASGSYKDSIVSLMKAKLREALEKKGSIELESKKVVANFTPITLALAGLACVVANIREQGNRTMWEAVLSVFMSATPCPAGIGVPIAMLSGMSLASKQCGATIKSGGALEALAKTNVVVLDKTGTLTNGKPTVSSFTFQSRIGRSRLLRLLASLEQYSTHPLGQAVVEYAKGELQNGEAILLNVDDVSQQEGRGMSGKTDGVTIRIGALDFCHSRDDVEQSHTGSEDIEAHFTLYCELNGEMIGSGRFTFNDELRETARPLIEKLKELNIRVIMLSGDRSGHLSAVAKELGVADYRTCWPHEKAEAVRSLRNEGKVVLMVGDGGNDSAALAAANVGMSIGSSNLASESATVVLMNEDLNNIVKLIKMSRHVVHIAKVTVKYGMSVSILQMIVSALGFSSPFLSAVLQECVDLSSVVHALRALSPPAL